MIELVSMHIPKCAGNSLRSALEKAYGAEAIHHDNWEVGDPAFPANFDPEGYFRRAFMLREEGLVGKRIVHGHFPIGKYAGLGKGVLRITFLRDPIERLISHYHFIRSTPTVNNLRRYVVEYDLSLLEFARIPIIRQYYSRTMMREVDEYDLDFVGFSETYSDSVGKLSRLLGMPLECTAENSNPAPDYADKRKEVLADQTTMARLRALLRDDIALYDRLRDRFDGGRCRSHLRRTKGTDDRSSPRPRWRDALWLLPRLARSRLFDAKWYRRRAMPSGASILPPLLHYLLIGRCRGIGPNPFFDPVWYGERYPDVAAARIDPLVHYLRHGGQEGRDPGPWFDGRRHGTLDANHLERHGGGERARK